MTDQRIDGVELSDKIKEISVAEFFEKNRHLLGYENPTKSLLTVVKEGVENALDACEEGRILPEIFVSVKPSGVDRFKVSIEDNGPGIVESKVPVAFGKFLVGSKFHRLRQSVIGEEKILIRKNSTIKSIGIGKFIDSLLRKNENIKDISDKNVDTVSFDPKTYKLGWRPISHVIRHKTEGPIYEIKAESGREVRITSSHSIFSLDVKNLIISEKKISELRKGDFIIVSKNIPRSEEYRIENINVLNFLDAKVARKHRWYLYNLDKEVFEQMRQIGSKQKIRGRLFYKFSTTNGEYKIRLDHLNKYEKSRMIPAHLFISIKLKTDLKNCTLRTYKVGGDHYDFPVIIPIEKDFVRLLGFWIAEGHLNNSRTVVFDFGIEEKRYIEEIKRISLKLFNREAGESPDYEKNKMRLIIRSVILCEFFKSLGLKSGAKKKEIPAIIFNLNENLSKQFLKALYSGDGNFFEERSMLTYTTVSRELASDLMYLLSMHGVFSMMSKVKDKGLGSRESTSYRVVTYGNELNKLWFNIKTSRKSWSTYTGVPSVLIKTFGRFNDLPKILERKTALSYMRFKYHKTNNRYFNILNSINSGSAPIGPNQFYLSQLENAGFIDKSMEITESGTEFLWKVERIKKLINSDFCFIRIKNIKKLSRRPKYVYDLSVPGCENFVAGLGGLICHNSRGIQGIGIHGAVLYSQLTTGKPIKLTSSTGKEINEFELMIDVTKNEPKIISHSSHRNPNKWHGIKIELETEGKYIERQQSIPEYLKQTAIVNPFAHIIFDGPDGKTEFKKTVEELPKQPKEIKPHPYGIELGRLRRMLANTKAKTIVLFLTKEFSRVGRRSAEQICKLAKIEFSRKPQQLAHEDTDRLHKAMQMVKLIAPPTDCLSPLGENLITEGMKKELPAEYFVAISRPPTVYRGYPFQIEVALAYGGSLPQNETSQLLRFANKVPLLYHKADCAITEAVTETDWRRYGLQQPSGSLPVGPLAIMVHLISVWVPFTSEGKQAIANYPEIVKEIKLALQDAGRKLAKFVSQRRRARDSQLRKELFEKYIPELAESLEKLTEKQKQKIIEELEKIIKKGGLVVREDGSQEKS